MSEEKRDAVLKIVCAIIAAGGKRGHVDGEFDPDEFVQLALKYVEAIDKIDD